MIQLSDIIHEHDYDMAAYWVRINLNQLTDKAQLFEKAYGKPLRVTSGFRSMADHLRIYAAKGITDQSKIPMKSKHLFGQAVDVVPVEDPIEHLHEWVNNNLGLMADLNLWFESFEASKSWVHLQTCAYGSWAEGKSRFFNP